jgi:predicted MPP superfamily phosphohydrolase
VEGLYECSHGPIAVSRGVGMSVIGARLTCRPELVLVTLHRA